MFEKLPLFSSWFYCLISEAANVFFFSFLMLIQHLEFEKPIFSEMQLLKNTRFSWGSQCLVLRYELNAYVNTITWVPHPCCGFTNLSSKSLVSFTFHTQLTFVTLGNAMLLGHPSVRKRSLGKPTRWAGTHGPRNFCPYLLGSVPLGPWQDRISRSRDHVTEQCRSYHDDQEARKDKNRI